MMGNSWQLFSLLVVLALIVHGFYSMLEMSCVSFNRVRLQYYVNKKKRRAIWLSSLLNHPARLFGTTLIGVNAAMQFGSECARRFYASLDLSPDWAPLTQVLIVLIFAELSPMFAARRYAENVAMLGIPLLYLSSLVMRPFIFCLDLLCRGIYWILGVPKIPHLYLSREELQKAIETREDFPTTKEFDPVLSNIFSLKLKTAKDLMEPLNRLKILPVQATVADLRHLLHLEPFPFIPLYHHFKHNIVAVTYPRDLLRLSDETLLRPNSRSPWFITEKSGIIDILKEFRRNNQSLAIVLSEFGVATGVLTLDAIIDEIFGRRDEWISFGEYAPEKRCILIERSFPGDTSVSDLCKWFSIDLESEEEEETLEELMTRHLGHSPERGESVRVGDFELTVEETSLIAGKTVFVHSFFGG